MPSTLVGKRLASHFMVFTLFCVVTVSAQAAKQRHQTHKSAPVTYAARADQCSTGNEPGCTTGPLSFLGRNFTDANGVYHPIDMAPDVSTNGNGLYGANRCAKDPDFHSTICRVTDYATGGRGTTFNMGSSGEPNKWAHDASAFIVNTMGGPLLFSFSRSSKMVSTPSRIGGFAPGGDATHFASHAVAFSSVHRNILYELDYGRVVDGVPVNQLNKVRLVRTGGPSQWELRRGKLFDFSRDSANCLPPDFIPNWTGVFVVSSNDAAFEFAFSDHGQNGSRDPGHPYGAVFLASWVPGRGCRVVNTYGTGGYGPMIITGDWGDVGPVLDGAGAPVGVSGGNPLYDVMYLHDGAPKPNPTYGGISGSIINACTPTTCSCMGKTTTGLCETYDWEVATRNIRPALPMGHGAKGNLYQYKGHRYDAFSYADPWHSLGKLLTTKLPIDNHGTYHNADSQDDQPVFLFTTKVCGQAGGAGRDACPPSYPSPLWDEIIAVENQVAHASARHCDYGGGPNTAACQYRFAHTFNTGTNWNFSVQNAIGNVSPNGRYALLPSDWNLQLGCTDGSASGCVDNIAASTKNYCSSGKLATKKCQRGDVFVVDLMSARPQAREH